MRRWQAQYTDADGKRRTIGLFDTQEEAAQRTPSTRASKGARAGLDGRGAARKTNPVVDGRLVPRADEGRFWGVTGQEQRRRWRRRSDASKKRSGYFDTQEDAARADNAAIRYEEDRRKTNPVVDEQPWPGRRRSATAT